MTETIIVTPPPQVQNVAAGGQQTQSATEAGAPQPSLSQGAIVTGTIAGKDANGNYLLKSSQGTYTIQSKVPLTYNSDVVIRLGANTAGGASARIVSVNGQPFADFATPEPTTSDSVSPTLLSEPPQTPPPPQTTALPATVVAAPAAQSLPSGATLQPGNSVIVRVPTTSLPTEEVQATQQQASAPPQTSPTVSASATVAVQPQQIAQGAQGTAAAQPPPPQAPSPITTTAASAVAVQSAAETDLAPAQTVTPSGQAPAQQEQPAQTPNATTSPLYSAYTKQSATATPTQPVAAPASSTSASATPTTIPAQIVSVDESGTISLQTPLGSVTVQTSALPSLSSIVPGTSVILELLTAAPAQVISTTPAAISELASSWQSLKDIVSLVSVHNAPATGALLSQFPEIGPSFLSQGSAFMAALLQGDAKKLLGGEVTDILQENGRLDLLEKFSGELANLGAAFNSPGQRPVPGWQPLFLPFVYQETLQQARIYVKRDNTKKERASKTARETRFVVEIDLSELGALQMDGLVRKKEQSTAFDLVIRSHQAFTTADQAEIIGIYTSAAQVTGFKGTLAFQVTHDFPVKPLEEASGEDVHSITV